MAFFAPLRLLFTRKLPKRAVSLRADKSLLFFYLSSLFSFVWIPLPPPPQKCITANSATERMAQYQFDHRPVDLSPKPLLHLCTEHPKHLANKTSGSILRPQRRRLEDLPERILRQIFFISAQQEPSFCLLIAVRA